MGTNVRLPKRHKSRPKVDFESSRSPTKSESWNKSNRPCWAVFPTWQYCRWSFVWSMYAIKRANRLSQAPVHCVTARVNLFTDQTMSSLPIRAKYKHYKSILLTLLQLIPVPPSARTWDVAQLFLLFCQFAISLDVFLSMSFHVVGPRNRLCVRFFPPWQLFSCSSRNSWFEHLCILFNKCFIRFAFTLTTSQIYVVKKCGWYSKIDQLHQFLQHARHVLLFVQPF